MIHLLDISWNIGDADTGDHERANELLGALPYLRELSVKADWDKIPFQPWFLSVNALTELKIISIFESPTKNRQYAKVYGPWSCSAYDCLVSILWCPFTIARSEEKELTIIIVGSGPETSYPSRRITWDP
jgi:hypothetical protein